MELYPGYPSQVGNKFVLDDNAIADSMALAMEKEMEDLYKKINNSDLPKAGQEDRRLLFVAISRGILKYLEDNQSDFIKSITFQSPISLNKTQYDIAVDLNIRMQ